MQHKNFNLLGQTYFEIYTDKFIVLVKISKLKIVKLYKKYTNTLLNLI